MVGKLQFLVCNYSGMEKKMSGCGIIFEVIWQKKSWSHPAGGDPHVLSYNLEKLWWRFCYPESCCPAFHLPFDSPFLSQERHYRLILQIPARFLWMHVRRASWRVVSCSGATTVCQSDSTCTNGTFWLIIEQAGCLRRGVAGRSF